MSRSYALTSPAERSFQPPQGIAQDFQTVLNLSGSIADKAANFRNMARQLGDLVAAFDR